MRKLIVTVAICVGAAGLVWAQGAAATKLDTQWKCSAPNPVNMIPVGDAPDHAYVIDQVKCVASKGEIAGVKEKDGMGTEFAEATGNNSKGHGIFVETLANGDKITYTYTFTGVSKDNKMVSGTNSFKQSNGTGKFKGMTGSGTCKAKGNPDGSSTFDCTGTYVMGK